MSDSTLKILKNIVFLFILIMLIVTLGGKNGQKMTFSFLAIVLLGMIIANKDKINPILNSLNS